MSNACKIWIKKGRGEPRQEHDPNGELVALRAKVERLERENTFLRGTVEALGDANDRLTIEVTELRKDRLFK